ncbi:MAG TPA: 23S rRNA (uracil(1939)-C(5))-methyltransferase RlmD [Solirubrobacteraceae bacterium]|nr:23S rRNA (uracil(1939)-C(5))-methyltransferase RlmD [Solirubrobacteraceae bacterium]
MSAADITEASGEGTAGGERGRVGDGAVGGSTATGAEVGGEEFKRPQKGDELELQIESLAFGGEGVARIGDGGYVVFVAGAIPGDRVRAVVHKRKRSYAHARTLEVLEPSAERIAPIADHPGVPWQVLPYERQIEIKQQQVDEALRRIGHLDGFELHEIVPAVEQWRYRNKLEYSFGEAVGDGDGAPGELICGFHAPAGGNRVTPIDDCLLASERGNRARELALAWCRAEALSAWDRGRASGVGPAGHRRRGVPDQRIAPAPDGRARLRNLVVREGRRTGKLQVRLVSTDGELEVGALAQALAQGLGDELSGVLWTRSSSVAETTAGGETELVWGEAQLPEQLGDLDLRISAEAFFQTNTEMAERLYGEVAQLAALEGWERVYDLYSGIGTIALTLAPRAGELWGIELIEAAVADAIAGAKRNEVTKANFFAGDTRLALPELLERAGRPDVLVVDPPRAGLSKKVVHRIIDASPKRIVYVSCNPTTLAPNAAELVESGWKLREVRPVDMFPQTHHIECVALFER